MRAVADRYPHFAHKKEEQQEEDKRLFYVAISRAMKRLVVSGAQSQQQQFTPYLRSILHRFTLRFVLWKYLIEIGAHEMRISEAGNIKRQYVQIDRVFESAQMKDQFGLKRIISNLGSNVELLENVDKFMLKQGITSSIKS